MFGPNSPLAGRRWTAFLFWIAIVALTSAATAPSLPALEATGTYTLSFSVITAGGSLSESSSYEFADRVVLLPDAFLKQTSTDYEIGDPMAAVGGVTASRNWQLYE